MKASERFFFHIEYNTQLTNLFFSTVVIIYKSKNIANTAIMGKIKERDGIQAFDTNSHCISIVIEVRYSVALFR